MAHWPQPYDHSGVEAWLARAMDSMRQHGYARWCCQRLADQKIVGDVGLMRASILGTECVDLGYIIHRDYWRNGYALEACRAVVAWARAQQIPALVATMATDNYASAGVARKLGMTWVEDFINPNNLHKPTHYFRLNLKPEINP